MAKRVMVLLLISLLQIPVTACGDNEDEIKQAIQSRYDQFDVAYKGRDRRSLEELFTSDCVFKQNDEGRQMTLPKFMKAMEFSFKAMTIFYIRTQIETLKLDNDTARVVVSMSTDVEISPPAVDGVKSRPQRVKSTSKYEDTWKKTPEGWKIVRRIVD